MEIFELLAIHPFSSLDELELAYHEAKDKIDPMKQADINRLDKAYQKAREILTREPNPGHFLELIKNTDDLIYLLNKFPEHGYQTLDYLNNHTGQFGINQIIQAFARTSMVGYAVSSPKMGVVAGLVAAATQAYRETEMQFHHYTPLARLVFSNFNAIMTSIEPSLVLWIGFHLYGYPDFIQLTEEFEKNTSSTKLLNAGKAFFSGEHVSFKPLIDSLWSKDAHERTRHLLAYVESISRLECELKERTKSEGSEITFAIDKLFSALKYVLIIDMQHADINTLRRNQMMLPSFYECIESQFQQLKSFGVSDILQDIEKKLPFAFQVQLSNAFMIQNQKSALIAQSHEPLEHAGGGLDLDQNNNNQSDEDEELPFFECATSDISLGYFGIDSNPFKSDSEDILLQVLNFIDDTLRKMDTKQQNPDKVSKALYLLKIQSELLKIHADLNSHEQEDKDHFLETQREKIQAYCHLLQYVANIETGQFSGCTSKITESFDQQTRFRLTGTTTHENLIKLIKDQYQFCFEENLEAKQQFLRYVAQRRVPEFIIQQLSLGEDAKLGNIPPTPKQMVKESAEMIQERAVAIRVRSTWDLSIALEFCEQYLNAFLEATKIKQKTMSAHSP